MMITSRCFFVVFLFLTTAVVDLVDGRFFRVNFSKQPKQDPYRVLGIRPRSTTKEIKTAYRNKAKEHHPDKNRDNAERAAEKFRELTEAYEFLSDERKKREYDERLNQEKRRKENQEKQKQENERFRQAEKEKKKREDKLKRAALLKNVRLIQKKVIRISTIHEFKKLTMRKNNEEILTCNLLLVFVANKKIEEMVDDEILFPYLSNFQLEDFEGAIKAVKVQYNNDTDLSRYLSAPSHKVAKESGKPFIMKGNKGQKRIELTSYIPRWSGGDQVQKEFEAWAMKILNKDVKILNRHHSPVHLFHVRGKNIKKEGTLSPNRSGFMKSRIGDEIWAMDVNVDNWPNHNPRLDTSLLNKNVLIGMWRITTSDQIYTVHTKRCIDMSASCKLWAKRSSFNDAICTKNPDFMHRICAKTCGVCNESPFSSITYSLLHEPITGWQPHQLQEAIKFLRVFVSDLAHVLNYRKNAITAFSAIGISIAFILNRITTRSWYGSSIRVIGVLLIYFLTSRFLSSNLGFRIDLQHVLNFRKNVIFAFTFLGFLIGFFIARSLSIVCRVAKSLRKIKVD